MTAAGLATTTSLRRVVRAFLGGRRVYFRLRPPRVDEMLVLRRALLGLRFILIIFIFIFARPRGSSPPDNENQQRQGHGRFEE